MNYKIYYPLVATTMLLLNACGTGESSSTSLDESINGKLVDSPVAGVTYKCGDITATTDENGSFECSSFPIEFYVGKIKLGSIEQLNPNGYVTPQDLAGVDQNDTTDENVTKIAQFLQSIDDDGDIEENIKIDAEITKNLEALDTNCSDLKEMTHDELENLLDLINAQELVTQDEAIKHLQEHMHLYLNCDNNNSGYPQGFPPREYNGDTNSSNPHEHFTNDFPHRGDDEDRNTSNTQKPTTQDIPQDRYHEDRGNSNPQEPVNNNENSTKNTPTSNPTDYTNDRDYRANLDLQQAYVEAINDARSEGRTCGEYGYMPAVGKLTWNDKLYNAAYEHSKDMAQSNTFSHTGSGMASDLTAKALDTNEGSTPAQRITANDYNWQRYGENIAYGTSMDDAYKAMDAWIKSPGHCKNIMKKEFKEVGMAMYYDGHKYYWTQDFGTAK